MPIVTAKKLLITLGEVDLHGLTLASAVPSNSVPIYAFDASEAHNTRVVTHLKFNADFIYQGNYYVASLHVHKANGQLFLSREICSSCPPKDTYFVLDPAVSVSAAIVDKPNHYNLAADAFASGMIEWRLGGLCEVATLRCVAIQYVTTPQGTAVNATEIFKHAVTGSGLIQIPFSIAITEEEKEIADMVAGWQTPAPARYYASGVLPLGETASLAVRVDTLSAVEQGHLIDSAGAGALWITCVETEETVCDITNVRPGLLHCNVHKDTTIAEIAAYLNAWRTTQLPSARTEYCNEECESPITLPCFSATGAGASSPLSNFLAVGENTCAGLTAVALPDPCSPCP